MENFGNRIVILIDMDCFFCQVETRLQPEFAGKPLAVVQYNQWKLGGIIAVNYEARNFGVTRHMRGEEAKAKCPELLLASVPCLRGKADTSRYRSAGHEVIDVLKKRCSIVERASVDEAYLDITQIVDDELSKSEMKYEEIIGQLKNTFVVGYSESGVNDDEQRSKGMESWLSNLPMDIQVHRLSIAGVFVENLRKEIFETTGFKCSAGISFNKILAKLACGLHKPNRQTILPSSAVSDLFLTLPVKKVRNLGGKLGDIVIDSLQCNVMTDLLRYSLQYLQNSFDEKTGLRLYNLARGIDHEPVTPRLVAKSIGACKNFPGKSAIVDTEVLKHWLFELSSEICERLEQDFEENERKASLLTVSFHYYQNRKTISQSRSCPLTSYKPEKITEQCLNIVIKATQQLPVSFLGISAGKFIMAKGSENFKNFFKTSASVSVITTEDSDSKKNIGDSKLNVKPENLNINIFDTEISQEVKNIKTEIEDNNESVLSINTKISDVSLPCNSIQQSLKSENFKKSFFMNILKEKRDKIDNSSTITKAGESSSENNDHNITSNRNLDSNSEHIIKDEIMNDEVFNSNSKHTIKDNKKIIHNEYFPSNSEQTIKNSNETLLTNSNNFIKQERNLSSDNQTTVELEEIFPDLNDIDPDIVRLLPPHLQEEVKKLLKTTKVHDKNIDTNKRKTKDINKYSKGKILKSKSVNKKSNIQTFFIKTDVKEDLDNFKKCPQCDQLILITKFDEHIDYHIAQTLQQEFNKTSNNEEAKKRKLVEQNSDHLKKRINNDSTVNILKTKSKSS